MADEDYPVLDGNGKVIVPAAWQDEGKDLYPVDNAAGQTVVADAWLDAGKPQYPVYNAAGDLIISVEQGGGNTPTDPPVNDTAPVVSGSNIVGGVLSCTTGAWGNSPASYAYQWRKGGVNIGGATASTYTTVSGDIGAAIDCVVRATNADGFGTKDSNDITVTNVPVPVNSVAPVVSGTATVGSVLSCTTGTWSNSPTGYAYQWRKNGTNIGGAVANTYTSVTGDIGAAIDCVVTASNAGGNGTPVDSNDITVTPATAWVNLAALFAGGADGIMIDLTNKDTLFQDASGAAPVVNNADPVGLALDQHKWGGLTLAAYRAAQPQLMVNGDFATDVSGWSVSTGGALSWQAGKLRLTNTNGVDQPYTYKSAPTTIGRWYELSLDFSAISGGTGNHIVYIGTSVGTGNYAQISNPANGTHRRFFKATTNTVHFAIINKVGNGVYLEIDNVSVKEIDGHHATQTSSARPAWASATSDVAFNGTSQYLVTDYLCDSGNNTLAAYFRDPTATKKNMMGALNSSTQRYFLGMEVSTGVATGYFGSNTTLKSTTSIASTTGTAMVDRGATLTEIAVNGVVEANVANAGTMPTNRGVYIGAHNNNGTDGSNFSGGLKRVIAGRFRVQDTMTAADFNANLIAA